jgi:hypothetical protein
MPEVQSAETDPKERREMREADQEEDQLGHLGCLSHEGRNYNYQHNNECSSENYKGHNHNKQMGEKERVSNSGSNDPRETKQIEVCKVNFRSAHNNQSNITKHNIVLCKRKGNSSLSNASTIRPMEAQSIQAHHDHSSVSSENNNNSNHHYNSSDIDPSRRVSLDSLEKSCPDSICGGGSETPKQCLGAHELKKTFALVGHKTPLLRRPFGEEALALVGHRHLRSAHFWIEEYAPVHTGIGCAHSVRRGARNILCISPCGQLCDRSDSSELAQVKESIAIIKNTCMVAERRSL